MDSVSVFSIASRNAQWVSARQAVVASNIANAGVSTYKASDTVSFAETLQNEAGKLIATDSKHLASANSIGDIATESTGKRVSLEDELVKSADVRNQAQLNTAIVSSFHRLLLMTVRV